jgi:hypothetical protein
MKTFEIDYKTGNSVEYYIVFGKDKKSAMNKFLKHAELDKNDEKDCFVSEITDTPYFIVSDKI